jgi:2-iminobutanoate/2-iminopropanoate deaminase
MDCSSAMASCMRRGCSGGRVCVRRAVSAQAGPLHLNLASRPQRYARTVSSERQIVHAPGAPPAIGPYSHAVRAGELLFCSGQVPLDPATGELVGETAAEQARVCLENLRAVCEAAGCSLERAVRMTVYMTDLADFAAVNEIYGGFFGSDPPARVAVGVAALPRGAYVEIDAVVAL